MSAERLCEGCGLPLVGKRRGAEAHGSTCRSKKRRRRLRSEAVLEVCCKCGVFCSRLDDETGWCAACARGMEAVA